MAYLLEATDSDEYFHDTDYEILGNQGLYGVIEGCAVTLDSGNMTLDIAAGYILHNGSMKAVAAQANVLTLVADSSNERWSYITLNSSAAGVLVSGTAAASRTTEPTKPELGDRVLLGMVKIQAGQTVANNVELHLVKRLPVAQDHQKGSDITAASGITVTHHSHDITGSTTITSLGAAPTGWRVLLHFDSTPQITHNASSLYLIGAQNATMVANEQRMFESQGSSNWREIPLVPADLVDGGASALHTHAIAGTSSLWVQPHSHSGTGTLASQIGDHATSIIASTSADGSAYFAVPFPPGFVSVTKAVVIAIAGSSNDLRYLVETDFGANGQSVTAHTDSIAATTLSMTASALTEINVAAAFTGVAAGDYLGMEFQRVGTNAADTINTLDVVGLLVEYSQ